MPNDGWMGREKVDSASAAERNRIESTRHTRALTESRAFVVVLALIHNFFSSRKKNGMFTQQKEDFLNIFSFSRWLDFFHCLLYSHFFLFGGCQQTYNTLRFIFDTKLNWVCSFFVRLRWLSDMPAVSWLTFSVDCRLTISYSRAVSHHLLPS